MVDSAPAPRPELGIVLHDDGGGPRREGPVLKDAQNDNVWFLRHLGGELGREVGKGPLGIVDPEDVEMLEDLVLAAITDGLRRSHEMQQESLGGVTGGIDLGALGGLLG